MRTAESSPRRATATLRIPMRGYELIAGTDYVIHLQVTNPHEGL